MRQATGCKSCREGHLKCVKVEGSERCQKCIKKDRECIQNKDYRFRPVTSVKFNAGDGAVSEQRLTYEDTQVWVKVPTTGVQFIASDGDVEGEALGVEPEGSASSLHSNNAFPQTADEDYDLAEYRSDHTVFHDDEPPLKKQALFFTPPGTLPCAHDTAQSPSLHFASISNILNSPSSVRNSDIQLHNELFTPVAADTPFSPASISSRGWPITNVEQARLFHHFIVHCSPWIDVCDPKCHFGKEIPKRAAQFSVILNGLLAVAARHLAILGVSLEDVSQPYEDECVRLVIEALEDPEVHKNENFLVAVILLRLHEEMGVNDEQRHNFGSANVLNSITIADSNGGLLESASWVSLRQHIYISLTTQKPMELNLDNYRKTSIFRDHSDESWANRIIFVFAKILNHVFKQECHLTRDEWAELDAEAEEWRSSKPWSFVPIFLEEPVRTIPKDWPELRTAHPAQAVGLQYYHLCRIILAIYDPKISRVGIASHKSRKASEEAVRHHIRIIIGYTISNDHVMNAMFQVSHILSACGAYVTDREEQKEALKLLHTLQKTKGWRTEGVIRDLKEQWQISSL